jgi:uncharacterized protein (UPF0261 family)
MTDTGQNRVVLLGTMDTKGAEYAFVRDQLRAAGLQTLLVDAGVLGDPAVDVDISRDQVAEAAGTTVGDLVAGGDRGSAVLTMADGARRLIESLYREHRFDAAMALGGTGGTSIAAAAFAGLPIGVPKIIVSTVASGDTAPYIGESDLLLLPSVVDVAGINRISRLILTNAAGALIGMLQATAPDGATEKTTVAASMFGVTTPCIEASRALLEAADFEVLVFHMTGTGGRSLERLVSEGQVAGVLDATTTELADELVGGVFSAGPERLTSAARHGVPQVVSVGALDMVNFGAQATVPHRFRERNLLVHNANVTLMRTTPQECAELGRRLAERVSQTTAPATVVLPLKGVSAVSVEGGPFHDPDADRALFDAIRANLDGSRVDLVELDAAINDPVVAETMTSTLRNYLTTG